MANRVIRDWTASETVDELSIKAEVFFTRLIMKADDYGNYTGNPRLINAALFPLKGYEVLDVCKWMEECEKQGLIVMYENEGKKYLHIPNFGQTLRRMKAVYPAPNIDGSMPTFVGQVTDNGGQVTAERKGKEIEKETRNEREDSLSFLGIDKSVEKLLADEYWHHSINHLTKGKDLGGAIRSSFAHIECQPSRFATATLNDLKKVTLSWLENKKPVTPDLKAISQKDRLKNI